MQLLTSSDIVSRWEGTLTTAQTERVTELLVDATALAVLAAPCLASPNFPEAKAAAARAIVAQAVMRAMRAGGGEVQTQSAGPFSVTLDTRTRDGWAVLTRIDRDQLAALCPRRGPVRSILLSLG